MSISPILFSGIKEDSHKRKNASLLDQACDVFRRGKGIDTPFKIALQAFAWIKWIPFNHPVLSLISQGRSIIRLCRPSHRPVKVVAKAIGLWKRGAGVGTSTVNIGKRVVRTGWNSVEVRKVFNVVKDFFIWTLSMVNWGCKALLLVSDEFLGSIASRLPDMLFKVGMITTAPLLGASVIQQVKGRIDREGVEKPENRLLREVHTSANKVMSLGVMSVIFKFASFCFFSLSAFSILIVPTVIPLAFSTVGLSSSVAALYEGKKGNIEQNHVRVAV